MATVVARQVRREAAGRLVLLRGGASERPAVPWEALRPRDRDAIVAVTLLGWLPPRDPATVAHRARYRLGGYDGWWLAPGLGYASLRVGPPACTRDLKQAWRALTRAREAMPGVTLEGLALDSNGVVSACVRVGERLYTQQSMWPADALCRALVEAAGVDVGHVTPVD